MAKNTNPITKKIYGQNSWSTITFNDPASKYPADIYHDIFVRKLIHGACLKLNLLTSQIQILKHATGIIEINFMFIPSPSNRGAPKGRSSRQPQFRKHSASDSPASIRKLIELKTCIKSILELKFNKTYKFKILQAPNIFCNAKILSDMIEIKLSENPRTHRPLLLKLFSDFKKTAGFARDGGKQSKMSLINLIKTYISSF